MLAGHEARSDSVPHSTDTSRSCKRPDEGWGRCNLAVLLLLCMATRWQLHCHARSSCEVCQHDVQESRETAHRQVGR